MYAPKAATASRHEMPVILAFVSRVLLRLFHGLVIVLLLVAGDGLGGDRRRLLAARVHFARRESDN